MLKRKLICLCLNPLEVREFKRWKCSGKIDFRALVSKSNFKLETKKLEESLKRHPRRIEFLPWKSISSIYVINHK